MDKSGRNIAIGLGFIATGLYVSSPFLCVSDIVDAPPLASVGLTGTVGSLSISNGVTVLSAVTDVEYRATLPSDTRRLATTLPGLPPSVSAADLGARYPGGIFRPLKKPSDPT